MVDRMLGARRVRRLVRLRGPRRGHDGPTSSPSGAPTGRCPTAARSPATGSAATSTASARRRTPRLDAGASPLTYPFTAPNGTTVDRQVFGSRTFDLNTDGVAQYGLYADWTTDLDPPGRRRRRRCCGSS